MPGIECKYGQEAPGLRKTAIIARELEKLNLDIVALQETRLPGSGSLREKEYTFFWRGLGVDESRIHGVGFAVRNRLVGSITTPVGVSERIITLRLRTGKGYTTFVCAYAPTLSGSPEAKDEFYESLNDTLRSVSKRDQLLILGDFNARVGTDHGSWPTCLGRFGTGKMNENGQRLLELCASWHLVVTNTFFRTGARLHNVSWRHPRSGEWHQLDLVLARKADLNLVKVTRSFHGADCDSDHSLVVSVVETRLRSSHLARPSPVPRINAGNSKVAELRAKFASSLDAKISEFDGGVCTPDESWGRLRQAIHESAVEAFGTNSRLKHDWMEEYSSTLRPLLEQKRTALIAHKRTPSDSTKDRLKAAKAEVQRTARKCANEYWTNLCTSIQVAADRGDTKSLFEQINKAIGPRATSSVPIKAADGSDLTDIKSQLNRWVEHYSELYGSDSPASPGLEEVLVNLPEMAELDECPTMDELRNAIAELKDGKACGEDGIPAEVLKTCTEQLLPKLYELLTLCWETGTVPHDMRNAKIVTLYKNKGDKGDCNNYRGISLLSVTGKAFARILLTRLHKLAERVLPETQCGFRAGRSTVDMVFTLRQLQEKCREQNLPLYMAFIDLTKAFDTVSRAALYKVLKSIGCPPILLNLVVSFHEDMEAKIQYDGRQSRSFHVRTGVKQGCVLAPTLFGIYFAALLRHAFEHSSNGIYVRTRTDGSLFNIQRLRSRTLVSRVLLRELLFADDAALVSHSNEGLQQMLDSLHQACRLFGLTISQKKTEIMGQGVPTAPQIMLNGQVLKTAECFTYLGSAISASLDAEISARIAKAATAFGKLTARVWQNKHLTVRTKCRVYQTCILSTMLYGCETWTTYAKQERRLNSFHQRCLRKILGISWQDRISNETVLTRSGQHSMPTILGSRRLRWLGHVDRMSDHRLPKQVLYGELEGGARKKGCPLKRFKDLCKTTLKDFGIDANTWRPLAGDRSKWRTSIHKGARERETRSVQKRARKLQTSTTTKEWPCTYCSRICKSQIGLLSHERKCQRLH